MRFPSFINKLFESHSLSIFKGSFEIAGVNAIKLGDFFQSLALPPMCFDVFYGSLDCRWFGHAASLRKSDAPVLSTVFYESNSASRRNIDNFFLNFFTKKPLACLLAVC
jgi:hypothetical protein